MLYFHFQQVQNSPDFFCDTQGISSIFQVISFLLLLLGLNIPEHDLILVHFSCILEKNVYSVGECSINADYVKLLASTIQTVCILHLFLSIIDRCAEICYCNISNIFPSSYINFCGMCFEVLL